MCRKGPFNIYFSRKSDVSGIETTIREHFAVPIELVLDKDTGYMKGVFGTDDFYGTVNPRLESHMLLARTKSGNG